MQVSFGCIFGLNTLEIRNNVLLPIMFVMFCLSILRTQLMAIFMGKDSGTLEKVYDAQITQRTKSLLMHGSYITPTGFAHRKLYFNHEKIGLLTKKATKVGEGPEVPKMDAASMMKGQFAMLVTNLYMITIYNVVDHAFSGFIAAKLPFSLFRGFKAMLQAGIDLADLEVSYISSSSWYLLNFTGMAGVNEVLLGPKADINLSGMTGMQPQGQQGMMATDSTKIFQGQKDSLEIKFHSWEAEGSLARLAAFSKKSTKKPTSGKEKVL
eukprot:TRINITY_DN5256_c0_g1_i2.p1 TRINITY_DN5256_c0_g1~~TRINITY_DN5256_c0_g1_i2.p1  ORF type:complete len:277 (-),score=47.22 TRINITY_DN5256_c0_g1_i2:62-862(-)